MRWQVTHWRLLAWAVCTHGCSPWTTTRDIVDIHTTCALEPYTVGDNMPTLNSSALLSDIELFVQELVMLEIRASCELAVAVTARHSTRGKSSRGKS